MSENKPGTWITHEVKVGAWTPREAKPSVWDKTQYYIRLINLFGSNLIAYWPLWESSGAVAADLSGNARNGAYTGVDFNYPGIGDGKKAPYFDGANDYVNVYTASLAGAFSGAEGSAMCWAKAVSWVDGVERFVLGLYVDANNFISLERPVVSNYFICFHKAGGTIKECDINVISYTGWFHIAFTWSKSNDRVKAFVNGAQYGATLNGLGTWSGALSSTASTIGSTNTTPTYPWNGNIAHALILNREATAAEVAIAAKVN